VAEGLLVGWICWGPDAVHPGTFELYWIVVDRHGRVAGSGARWWRRWSGACGRARLIVVETAGRDDYAATRAFYARADTMCGATIRGLLCAGMIW
jgi:hypothetical protein